MIPFTHSACADIRAHARFEYPRESCGIIVGGQYLPQQNIAADPLQDFRIAPEIYLGQEVEAIVHSHPDGPDHPTASDMRGQQSWDVPWGICVVTESGPGLPFFWGDSLPISPLKGRVYRHGVADCYALSRDYFRLKGRVLPDVPRDFEWWVRGADLYADGFHGLDGIQAVNDTDLQKGDAILFRIKAKVFNHVGIYTGDGRMLHHYPARLSGEGDVSRWMRFPHKVVRVKV